MVWLDHNEYTFLNDHELKKKTNRVINSYPYSIYELITRFVAYGVLVFPADD